MGIIEAIESQRRRISSKDSVLRAYRDPAFAEKCRVADDLLSCALRYAVCGHERKALRLYIISARLYSKIDRSSSNSVLQKVKKKRK